MPEMKRPGAMIPAVLTLMAAGCNPQMQRLEADRVTHAIIAEKQQQALGRTEPLTIERPADTLRRRLMIGQDLPYTAPAALGIHQLGPIKHWPDDDYLKTAGKDVAPALMGYESGVLRLSLLEALAVAAHNSNVYQSQKEQVYLAALDLDLARDEFRTTFAALVGTNASADWSSDDLVSGVVVSPTVGLEQRFKSGLIFTTNLALDLVQLLSMDRGSTLGITSDTTIFLPLMRGAGEHIVTEPLTQAERNVVYAIYDFEQFKREFAVEIASQYLGVLQQLDSVQNAEESYRRLILAANRSRRMSAAGRLPEIQVDQAVQQELTARDRWISAQQSYADELDDFKVLLGLPPDAHVELERDELARLARAAEQAIRRLGATVQTTQPTTAATGPSTQPALEPATTQEVHLEPPSMAGAGPYELPEAEAFRLALDHRPDLRIALGQVYDSQRRVVVAANGFLPTFDLIARASFGEGRGLGSADSPSAQLRPELGTYTLSLPLELPLERTAERNQYRESLIALERSIRDLQDQEDDIKLAVRGELRGLLAAREGVRTQAEAVTLARRRVDSTNVLLQAGRAEIRDVLEAQTDLVDAQDDFTSALVEYRISELELQAEMGVLEVNEEGIWEEYQPQPVAPQQVQEQVEELIQDEQVEQAEQQEPQDE